MDGYTRKKCVAKILYMYVLGYEPDFGYAEALRLLSSKKFSEKQMVRTSTVGVLPRFCSLCHVLPLRSCVAAFSSSCVLTPMFP